jgi:hypothetical protein
MSVDEMAIDKMSCYPPKSLEILKRKNGLEPHPKIKCGYSPNFLRTSYDHYYCMYKSDNILLS